MVSSGAIKQRAKELGFDLCGIAPATDLPELAALPAWLARGYAGEMHYLAHSVETRGDVRRFLPGAESVIVTGSIYFTTPDHGPPEGTPQDRSVVGAAPDVAQVARYAWGEDYHAVIADRLEALVAWMREAHGERFDARVFVDKHHVQERVYALHAGVGWIGKNTCVINPELGSWFLIGGIACSLPLEPDSPGTDQCGTCTLCIDACPTGAIVDEHVLDATKCISYLTIELNGSIPEGSRSAIGSHLFGCDVCQDVCPWNLAPLPSSDPAWQPRAHRDDARARELWERDDRSLHGFVKGSAMTYVPLSRLRRNLAVVLGNSGDPDAAAALDRPGHGVHNAAMSAEMPLVQEHVAWARNRLRSSGRG
jgi:epoxyqueuosine reductase